MCFCRVTRLIKVSKSQKPTRESLLIHHPSASSSSLKSDFSSGFNATPKLNTAQAELQACEAHLAEKERELDHMRADALREGLRVRCTAMVECGWAWGEMGKEGLRAVEDIGESQGYTCRSGLGHPFSYSALTASNAARSQSTQVQHKYQASKPLPTTDRPSSDLSSLAPSQSASQTPSEAHNHIQHRPNSAQQSQNILQIPPAHSISDFAVPTSRPTSPATKHVLARRITEEALDIARHSREGLPVNEEHGSSEDEDVGPVQVVENARFAGMGGSVTALGGGGDPAVRRHFSIRSPGTKSDLGPVTTPAKRERRVSSSGGFFGSIRGLFKRDKDDDDRGGNTGYSGEKKWATRTERNLKKRDDDSSDEEHLAGPVPLSPTSPVRSESSAGGGRRLTKGKTSGIKKPRARKGEGLEEAEETDRATRAVEWVGGQERGRRTSTVGTMPEKEKGDNEERGWMSDGGVPVVGPGSGGQGAMKPKSISKSKTTRLVPKPPLNLSRNSSIRSAASAPISPSPRGKIRRASLGAYPKSGPNFVTVPAETTGQRRDHIGDESPPATTPSKAGGTYHMPNGGGPLGEGSVSLMSIVEGVARQNRDGWRLENWDQMYGTKSAMSQVRETASMKLQVIKAPPPVTRDNLDASFTLVSAAAYAQAKSAGFEVPQAPRSMFPAGPTVRMYPMPNSAHGANHGDVNGVGRAARPAKSPLRSALRSSRSPSPLPSSMPALAPITPRVESAATRKSGGAVEDDVGSDDEASLSSYETGHEGFEDETETAPPPPPHDRDPTHHRPLNVNGGPPEIHIRTNVKGTSDISASSASTEAPLPPRRRKSVRVSLQPTFSTTPPALDDHEYGDRHAPWEDASQGGGGWQMRHGTAMEEGGQVKDLWEDSSEEDEQYTRARRLLAKGRKPH